MPPVTSALAAKAGDNCPGGTSKSEIKEDFWDSTVESCMTSVASALAAKAGDHTPAGATDIDTHGD